MRLRRRYKLRKDRIASLVRSVAGILLVDVETVIPKDATVEIVETDEKTIIYFVDGKPCFVRRDKVYFPVLHLLNRLENVLPRVVVDMGAVPFVASGADIMRPGIVDLDQNLGRGDVVVVVDEKHGKPLAVGTMLLPAGEALQAKRGKIIQNLHHIGDKLWRFLSTHT